MGCGRRGQAGGQEVLFSILEETDPQLSFHSTAVWSVAKIFRLLIQQHRALLGELGEFLFNGYRILVWDDGNFWRGTVGVGIPKQCEWT